jgi:pimeloyl-ACP methyl ester carboxylesterase
MTDQQDADATLWLDANGVRFHATTRGPVDGPLVLVLHGFPDSPWSWQPVAERLAAEALRVVTVTMRGYLPTGAAPDGRYDSDTLGADANALRRVLSPHQPAVLIGHDWGASAVYTAITSDPGSWTHAVAMSVPLLAAGGVDTATITQMRRSFYSYLFQLPIAETLLRRDHLQLIDELWRCWSPGLDAPEAVAAAKSALATPESLDAAITYYRHNPSVVIGADEATRRRARAHAIGTPLLYLHGSDDGCIGTDVLDLARGDFPAGTQIEVVSGVGHFLQVEQPDVVASRIVAFLHDHAQTPQAPGRAPG